MGILLNRRCKNWGKTVTGLAMLWGACQPAARPARQELIQLTQQVHTSCTGGLTYHQQVSSAAGLPGDTIQVPYPAGHPTDSCAFVPVVLHALSVSSQDPALAEYFEVVHTGDTVVARRLPAHERHTELALQKVVRTPAGVYRYLESRLNRMSWLYHQEEHIVVHFDETGRYLSHTAAINTRLPLTGKAASGYITGSAAYE